MGGGWPTALPWPSVSPELGAHPPVLCLRLASINHHGLRALTLLELWEGWGKKVVQSRRNSTGDVPQDKTSGTVSEGVPNLAGVAGLRKQSHISSLEGTLEVFLVLPCTWQKGKLSPLGEPVAIWRPHQGPLFGALPSSSLPLCQTQMLLNFPPPEPKRPLPSRAPHLQI